LELDLVLVPFAEQYFQCLTDADQDAYVKLLTCEDQDLLSWWLQQTQPDDRDLVRILDIIRERHGTASVPPA
jgi:antitoxin CptB